jgi:natural resistance-associated macrophage protein
VIATFAAYKNSPNFDPTLDIDLKSASVVLATTFGDASKYIWAVGLLAAGQSSTMTGTYAGQFVMEGFLNFQLPIYQRVLLTRSIAIVPALMIAFVNPETLTNLDTYLNIMQSVQLPFALVPLLKFVGSQKVMGQFRIAKWQIYFASTFGVLLFTMNFVIFFSDSEFTSWKTVAMVVVFCMVYVGFIINCIVEPISELKKLTKAELDDHEYERIVIDDDFSDSFESNTRHNSA